MEFYIVDVFGNEKYSGNQLAVVVLQDKLPQAEMQKIANEFHFSETTFISLKDSYDNQFKVNIFTPLEEVPFAGHPVLGTAFIIKNEILKANCTIVLDLAVGKIPVTVDENGLFWMKQMHPQFGGTHKPSDIAPLISLSEEEIDANYPVQDVSTGLEFMLIPLKKLKSVQSASTNLSQYRNYFQNKSPKPLFLFCPETYHSANQINCRMFADMFGIAEDPATGSANGCLAAYLIKHRYFNSDKINISVEQGFEIKRKSILFLNSFLENGMINIYVGGKVFQIAKGCLV